MSSNIRHPVIPTENDHGVWCIAQQVLVQFLNNLIHFQEFGWDEWRIGSMDMSNVIQAQVVKDGHVPGRPQLTFQVPRYIVVDFLEVRDEE